MFSIFKVWCADSFSLHIFERVIFFLTTCYFCCSNAEVDTFSIFQKNHKIAQGNASAVGLSST